MNHLVFDFVVVLIAASSAYGYIVYQASEQKKATSELLSITASTLSTIKNCLKTVESSGFIKDLTLAQGEEIESNLKGVQAEATKLLNAFVLRKTGKATAVSSTQQLSIPTTGTKTPWEVMKSSASQIGMDANDLFKVLKEVYPTKIKQPQDFSNLSIREREDILLTLQAAQAKVKAS